MNQIVQRRNQSKQKQKLSIGKEENVIMPSSNSAETLKGTNISDSTKI